MMIMIIFQLFFSKHDSTWKNGYPHSTILSHDTSQKELHTWHAFVHFKLTEWLWIYSKSLVVSNCTVIFFSNMFPSNEVLGYNCKNWTHLCIQSLQHCSITINHFYDASLLLWKGIKTHELPSWDLWSGMIGWRA